MAARIYYADLWGLRQGKYQILSETDITTTNWRELQPNSPFYFFLPRQEEFRSEYEEGWEIRQIFPVNSTGIVTARDSLVIDFEQPAIWQRLQTFLDKNLDDVTVKERLSLSENYAWRVSQARKELMAVKEWESLFNRILYRPFDIRSIYYHPSVVWRTRSNVMRHMLAGANLGLISARSNKSPEMNHFFCSRFMMETKCGESTTQSCLFPLYLYPTEGEMQFKEGRRPNLNPEFVAELERRLGARVGPYPLNPLSVDGEGAGGEVRLGAGGEVKGWSTAPDLWERLKPVARQMRREPTPAENLLWQHLRHRQLSGFRFRRQHSIERFIVDFYCAEAGLVVEVEGPVHQYQQEEDKVRQAYLESRGLRLLRFSNDQVLHHTEEVLQQISTALTAPSPPAEREPEGEVITPEDIFNYAYAVFHSPTYRRRYAEFLKIDFPRLPLTSDKKLFRALAEKGAELVALHLTESPALNNLITKYSVPGSNVVEKVVYNGPERRVHINKSQYVEGVPPEVWNFQIGGYQVCQKWLKDRQGRTLTFDDLLHYQKVVVALRETIRLLGEIDALIPGWPIT